MPDHAARHHHHHHHDGAAPEAWVEAYNEWVAHAEEADHPHHIELPAARLHPDKVREILKLLEPGGDD